MTDLEEIQEQVEDLESRVEALEYALRAEWGEAWNAYVRQDHDH
jgi:tetrahydromethanopterin S-methyltransferase subunit B